MKKKTKIRVYQEWAGQVTALRQRLHINQAELARKLQCSAMTISRWERGLLQPSAEHFIQLGNLGDKNEAWSFWERAGIQPAKMVEALNAMARSGRRLETPRLERARAGAAAVAHHETADLVGLPLLNAVVGTHGVRGDRRSSLQTIASSKIIGAPAPWCPNPAYTSLIRVKGHSMEPLIRNNDILAVDAFQTERSELYGKIVIVSSDKSGLIVSRLRRYENLDILEPENRQYEPVVLHKTRDWRIVARVLWWISQAP